jgi:hypothetical protein
MMGSSDEGELNGVAGICIVEIFCIGQVGIKIAYQLSISARVQRLFFLCSCPTMIQ